MDTCYLYIALGDIMYLIRFVRFHLEGYNKILNYENVMPFPFSIFYFLHIKSQNNIPCAGRLGFMSGTKSYFE